MFGMEWLKPEAIITSFGAFAMIGVMLIVFIETGLLVGFFLPGDSLLFLVGLNLGTIWHDVPIWLACALITLSGFAGDQTGYWIGYKIGPPLFEKKNGIILNRHVLDKTHEFFERYGTRAILLARFIPVLRALIPMLAGISKMDIKKFTKLNFWGATLWVGLFMLGGYWLGQLPFIRENLEATVLVIVVVTTMMIPIEYIRDRISRRYKVRKTQKRV
mgnify:CR=1 FL=1